MQENKRQSCLKGDQEEQLLVLEQAARILSEQAEDGQEAPNSESRISSVSGENCFLEVMAEDCENEEVLKH
jgi:hypothetical protein